MTSLLLGIMTVLFVFSCSGPEKPTNDNKQYEIVDNPNTKKETKSPPITKDTKASSEESSVPQEQIDKAKKIIARVEETRVAAVDAEKKFKQLCSICHGTTGDLNLNGAKDLTKSTLPLEESFAQVYNGKGLMTPFGGMMTDSEIIAVCKYADTLRK